MSRAQEQRCAPPFHLMEDIMYDPRMSDWENTVESARERENEESSIEHNYPPPCEEEPDA